MRFCVCIHLLACENESEHGVRLTLELAAEEYSQGKAEIVIEMQPRSYRWRRRRVTSIPLYQEQRPPSEPQRNSPQHISIYRSSLYIASAESVTRAALTGHESPPPREEFPAAICPKGVRAATAQSGMRSPLFAQGGAAVSLGLVARWDA